MVMKMNKAGFLKALGEKTNLNEEKCIILNDILESNFFIGKKNKEKIIIDIKEKLSLNENEADKLYEIAMSIIGYEIKNKIMHPFKSQD